MGLLCSATVILQSFMQFPFVPPLLEFTPTVLPPRTLVQVRVVVQLLQWRPSLQHTFRRIYGVLQLRQFKSFTTTSLQKKSIPPFRCLLILHFDQMNKFYR
jgi:hypothetical protein